ncbi:MAG: S-layer family protein [Spirulina sp. SIO3F2]|nr:S-layer family protein [Spirulina sp. SIO3F2]
MTNSKLKLRWQMLKRAAIVLLVFGKLTAISDAGLTQTVTRDGTTATTITPTGSAFVINGGDTSGTNLFHSFTDFSPATLTTLFNVSDGSIERIISRVTGNNISSIDGILSVMGGNSPDFFLINPNGIVFGANAVLNVPGSFLASTAESIQFADGNTFSTTGTPLLSMTAPVGLGFGSNPGSITNAATLTQSGLPLGLTVGTGETIGLVGGDVNLTGGFLTAPEGRVELGAVGANATVGLTTNNTGYVLDYSNTNNFADLMLSNGAIVSSSSLSGVANTLLGFAPPGLGAGASGPIQLRGDRITLEQTQVAAIGNDPTTVGSEVTITGHELNLSNQGVIFLQSQGAAQGASLTIDITNAVNLVGIGIESTYQTILNFLGTGAVDASNQGAIIFSVASAQGNAGDVTLRAEQLNLQTGAVLGNATSNSGAAGNVVLELTQGLTVAQSTIFSGTSTSSTGTGGNITIQSPTVQIQDGARISATVSGAGQGGDIAIQTERLELSDSRLSLPLLNNDPVLSEEIARTSVDSNTSSTGNAGNITIDTQTLQIQEGATIETSSISSLLNNSGQGGQININASQSVTLTGRLQDGSLPSALDVSTSSASAAGNLNVNTGQLIVEDGAQINATTTSAGSGGSIGITTSSDITLRNQGLITTSALGTATGRGGDINLTSAGSLYLNDASQITATTNQGDGGNLALTAGNILLLRRGSLISTTAGQAGGSGNGGNITINAPVIAGYDNSDIVANAFAGNGGNINITTQGIFGLAFRDQLTADNDITASSQFGVNGTITVNEFSLDPSSGLVELVAALSDASDQVDATCAAAGDSEFIATGRGGIPPTPDLPRGGMIRPWQDLRALDRFFDATVATPSRTTASTPTIREATGFQQLSNGQIALVSEPSIVHNRNHYANCAMGASVMSGNAAIAPTAKYQ